MYPMKAMSHNDGRCYNVEKKPKANILNKSFLNVYKNILL
jgi:hypothetical protein